MRNPASQGRTDANQRDVVHRYHEWHCSVVDLHQVGGGVGDLLVGIAGIVNDLVEVKLEDGKIRPSQVTFNRDWRGRKVVIVRSIQDVDNHVQRVRKMLKEAVDRHLES